MARPKTIQQKQQSSMALGALLLALMLRVLVVPIHLAQEEHSAPGEHPFAHALAGEGHGDDGHEHDEDHVPHPALDHAPDLFAQRVTSKVTAFEFGALLPDPLGELPEHFECERTVLHAACATEAPVPRAPRSRAPPAQA